MNSLRLASVAVLAMTFCGLVRHSDRKPTVVGSKREVHKWADRIPHGQDRPPGHPLSPAEAMARMQVPPGFHVELVAAEPDLVNPVSMTFDERGRIWVTESVEYPRKMVGPGHDRIKVLEDTDGDGRADKFTVFADGLNIPSGIAVGYGGVWVANAPDILFLQDTDGDGKADRREVVVTGFGRDDTHELPNSLSWGPDGWLYGLNGVFNHSHVRAGGKDYRFTCALFRIHPRTREFQLFCEGTSNPWGIAWDDWGNAFVSACVIDHLWHLVETGYYHRQGGPYPPFTWKIGSICDEKHQKAAYCGIHYFDSDAYPEAYRQRLYMGNIHGGCVNVDVLSRRGSTYRGHAAPDFLTANDAWFMPVAQKTGPDGSLYLLDWYDRYHCYQDAGRDPQGIDRLKGRLYRVRYKDTPRVWNFNLADYSSSTLVSRLVRATNEYERSTVVRLLCERRDPQARSPLERLVTDAANPLKVRVRAAWALTGSDLLSDSFLKTLLAEKEPALRAWGVRSAGNRGEVSADVRRAVIAAAHDLSPDVRLQAAIAAHKIGAIDPVPVLVDALANAGDDPLLPHIVWNNLQPFLERNGSQIVRLLRKVNFDRQPAFDEFLPRTLERLTAAESKMDREAVREALAFAVESRHPNAAQECLRVLAQRVQNREISGKNLQALKETLAPTFHELLSQGESPLFAPVALLAASWNEPDGIAAARQLAADGSVAEAVRASALEALISANAPGVVPQAQAIIRSPLVPGDQAVRRRVIASLSRLDSPAVAEMLIAEFPRLEPELQPVAIEVLTQRAGWSKSLLSAMGQGKVPRRAINLTHVRKLLAFADPQLAAQVRTQWGTVRNHRNPQREGVIAQMRNLIRDTPGSPSEGEKVFKRVCAQCHKIYGEGVEVGPDLTSNGRSSLDQMLSNIFDPNLVIGAAYRAVVVVTKEGRVLTGILAEDNPRRVLLKTQGGKIETIPRDDVDVLRASNVSLMPEQLENQLKPQEIVDLFAFLSYDKHPSDATARQLPGLRKNPAADGSATR